MQRTPEVRVINTRVVAPNVTGAVNTVNPYRRNQRIPEGAPEVRVFNPRVVATRVPGTANTFKVDLRTNVPFPQNPEALENARKTVNMLTARYIENTAHRHNKNPEDVTFEEFYDYLSKQLFYRNYESFLFESRGDEPIGFDALIERTFYQNQATMLADYNEATRVYEQAKPVMAQYTADDLQYFRTFLQQYISVVAEYLNKLIRDVTLDDFHNFLRIAYNREYLQFADDVADYYGLTVRALERFMFEQARQDLR